MKMNKTTLINVSFVTLFSSLMYGCNSNPPKAVAKENLPELENQIISLDFAKKSPLGTDLSKENIIKKVDLTESLIANTSYAKVKNLPRYRGTSVVNTKGLYVKKSVNGYELNYLNAKTVGRTYGTSHDVTKVVFNLDTKLEGNALILSYPKNYLTQQEKFGFSYIEFLDTQNNIVKDSINVYKSINKKALKVSMQEVLKGEVNTEYPATSVYANFKRILGSYRWGRHENITESKKKNSFSIELNGKKLPIYIEVFPYRNGSKVVYSLPISYELYSDGSSSVSQDEISNLVQRIESIIND